jgi:hypothetical protein
MQCVCESVCVSACVSACVSDARRALRRGNLSDLEYVLAGFHAAPVFDGPFDYITYWCNVWPPAGLSLPGVRLLHG